jgi:hypothetical protein
LRSKLEAASWLVVRGTTSVDDLLTDMVTITEPFLDGFAHRGILKAADSICRIVRRHLIRGDRLWLTGHSLGGATAAICTGPTLSHTLPRACRPPESTRSTLRPPSHASACRLQRQGRRLRAPGVHPPHQHPRRRGRPRWEAGAGAGGAARGAAARARSVRHRRRRHHPAPLQALPHRAPRPPRPARPRPPARLARGRCGRSCRAWPPSGERTPQARRS